MENRFVSFERGNKGIKYMQKQRNKMHILLKHVAIASKATFPLM